MSIALALRYPALRATITEAGSERQRSWPATSPRRGSSMRTPSRARDTTASLPRASHNVANRQSRESRQGDGYTTGREKKRTYSLADDATFAWLPYRALELNPLEDLWRLLNAVVAVNWN